MTPLTYFTLFAYVSFFYSFHTLYLSEQYNLNLVCLCVSCLSVNCEVKKKYTKNETDMN